MLAVPAQGAVETWCLLPQQTGTGGTKGDVLLVSDHVIEVVTRLHQALLETTRQALNLQIADQ